MSNSTGLCTLVDARITAPEMLVLLVAALLLVLAFGAIGYFAGRHYEQRHLTANAVWLTHMRALSSASIDDT